MNLEDKNVKKKIMIGIGIAFVILVVVGTSLALWSFNTKQTSINELNSSCLKISLKDENDAITLEKAHPITNDEGEALTPYTFTIQNTCTTSISYNVNLGITENSTLNAKYIAVKLGEDEKKILNAFTPATLDNYSEAYTLKTGTLSGKDSITYDLRLWMDETTEGEESMNKTFESKIVISASLNELAVLYKEDLLNGADPVLDEEGKLIPVTISEDNGKVTKADLDTEWYNYEDQKWANAVILTESGKNKNYKEFDEILEEDIESYFVWIPKYRYQIFDLGKYTDANGSLNENAAQTIEIEFGLTDTQDDESKKECATPNKSGADGQCDVGDWMTHPAFTAFEGSKGMWVGKFETGYDGATSTTEAEQHNEIAEDKVIIKPNAYSWTNITIKNMFDTSYAYQRELDSHMMKNTEWGAVAYLQHSKYGSGESVRINNNGNCVTGYAAKTEPTVGFTSYTDYERPSELGKDGTNTVNYTNPESRVASTTGNYTGVYDMSGGCWEYVMGVIKGSNGSGFTFGSSGFSTTTFPFKTGEEKSQYYDVYDYGTSEGTYNRRILGDAIGEMGPFGRKIFGSQSRRLTSWYDDEAWFAYSTYPWFTRGGDFNLGSGSGVFNFRRLNGGVNVGHGFRIVLAPTK